MILIREGMGFDPDEEMKSIKIYLKDVEERPR